jgi:hypothetical protein
VCIYPYQQCAWSKEEKLMSSEFVPIMMSQRRQYHAAFRKVEAPS